ncbi:MAG: hypothetical protein ACM3KR_08285 [Deltaproteobacteria bacterium]
MRKYFKFVLLLCVLIIFPIYSVAFAAPAVTVDQAKDGIYKAAGTALGYMQLAGVAIMIIVLAVFGITWFLASAKQRADLKRGIPVYLIGVVLLFGGMFFGQIVINMLQGLYFCPVGK